MKKNQKKVDGRILRITMINGDRINGQVNIERMPGYDRVSDLLSYNEEQFLVLMNASVSQKGIDTPVRHKVLLINKNHIIWAVPDDEEK